MWAVSKEASLGAKIGRGGENLASDSISLKKAVEDSLSMAALRKIFLSEDDVKNFDFLSGALMDVSPKVYVRHGSLQSEKEFKALCSKAKHFNAADKTSSDCIRIAVVLAGIHDQFSDKNGLSWDLCVIYYLNHEALRELFDAQDDLENGKLATRCFEEILKAWNRKAN